MLAFLEIEIQEKKKDCEERKRKKQKAMKRVLPTPLSASFQSNGKNDVSKNHLNSGFICP